MPTPSIPAAVLALSSPIKLEYMPGWVALLVWGALAAPVIALGLWSLAGLGKTRKWVAIVTRLLVLAGFVLLLGGIRWQRQNKDLDVIVLRDTSESIQQYHGYTGDSVEGALYKYLSDAVDKRYGKKPDDRIGIVEFNDGALISAVPNTTLTLDAAPITTYGNGTDVAGAIQLALATFRQGAMHRLLLVSDGNANLGDTDAAITAAASQHIHIDVMPLKYAVRNEILMERFIAPSWKREKEAFTLEVFLRSTNLADVAGTLRMTMEGTDGNKRPIALSGDPARPGKPVVVKSGLNRYPVTIPGFDEGGVYTFKASFEPDKTDEGAGVSVERAGGKGDGTPAFVGDTLGNNNTQEQFVLVRGKGKVLYVDGASTAGADEGATLEKALRAEAVNVERIPVRSFPKSLVQLQAYDAIILSNVGYNYSGLNVTQADMIASYVHDMGGGLVMIGGEDAFGAGGWNNSTKLLDVLPVDMDVPAQRQMPKGALVLVMHSCEMPNGNYWGTQCAIQAIATLSDRDEVGIISYNWGGGGGGGIGGAQWDYTLQDKGDGTRVIKAAKNMQLGDMPSFDDSLNLAMNGVNGGYCLAKSNARQKHVIIISDGDPGAPNPQLVQQYQANKVSVSTVTVYTHTPGTRSATMESIAKDLGGKAYGPIEANPNQLPQIFTKEATVVRRSLIYEQLPPEPEIAVSLTPGAGADEMVKNIRVPAGLRGMVLTSKKGSPNIEMPLVAGKNSDPLLVHWQTGLGKCAVFTSDAHNRWAPSFVGSPDFNKFWAQVVRGVQRPPMSTDFDVQTVQSGDHGHIRVEAQNKDEGFLNFLNVRGKWVGPDMQPHDIRLVQTGPGTYEADFPADKEGNYVAMLSYTGPKGAGGSVVSGMAVSSSPEQRDLQSNDAMLKQIAERTGGRLLEPWESASADLFSRQNIEKSASPLPVWDVLLPILMALVLIDVAIRRIAWDWNSTKRMAAGARDYVRSFTTTRKVETRQTLDALTRVRQEVAETKLKPQQPKTPGVPPPLSVPRPDRGAKFEAQGGVEGDITNVVGGASDKPIPPPPKKIEPKGATPAGAGGHTGSLLEAKRRAQQQIKEREQGGTGGGT